MTATYNIYKFLGRGISGNTYELRIAATAEEYKALVAEGLAPGDAYLMVEHIPAGPQMDAMIERTQLAQYVEPHSLRN